jgi:16S rRNA U516 pseudouridylate synthase RsuA-like enzyme
MKGISECAVLTIALAVVAQPVVAATYLYCATRRVVIISRPSGNTSSTREEDLGFWVDDAAKISGSRTTRLLAVSRLDRA